jgi:hypothetical protein
MRKVLSSACLVFLICFGGSAWAGKPKLAILGLEVAPGPTGVVDPAMTQVAKDITRELRQRAQSGASAYVVAPNSSKELTDEKLLMSCDNEARDCMAMIGTGLSADTLLYGHVEKRGDVYRVSLKLLDIKAKTVEVGSDEMPIGGSVSGVAKRLYAKLIGDAPGAAGALIVTARSQSGAQVDGGRVMVDEDRKGSIAGGKLTVTGLGEGRHVVAIEVPGLQRFEATVTVRGGEQSTLEALLLDKLAPPPSSHSHARLWKVSLGASLAVAVLGGGAAASGWLLQNHYNGQLNLVQKNGSKKTVGVDDCGATDDMALGAIETSREIMFNHDNLRNACKSHTANVAGFVVLGVGGLATVASLIMLIRDPGSEEQPPTGARSKKPDVAIAPILTPGVAGASLSVTW